MTIPEWVTVTSTLIPALVTAGVVAYGVNAWRRESVGKRRLEASEAIMTKLFQAVDAIRDIRRIGLSAEEMTSRVRSEGETAIERRCLDTSHAIDKRIQSNQALFAELRSLKYTAMSVFGPETEQPFNDIAAIVDEIRNATFWLTTYLWLPESRNEERSEDRIRNDQRRKEYEAAIWYSHANPDELDVGVQIAISKMDSIIKQSVGGSRYHI